MTNFAPLLSCEVYICVIPFAALVNSLAYAS